MSKAYPDIRKYSSARLAARFRRLEQEWKQARRQGMRLDSFSNLYLAGELERMQKLIKRRSKP